MKLSGAEILSRHATAVDAHESDLVFVFPAEKILAGEAIILPNGKPCTLTPSAMGKLNVDCPIHLYALCVCVCISACL